MSNLKGGELQKIEKLMNMKSGYVLDFSDRTFRHFFTDYRVDIDADEYKVHGTSKANRLRTFFEISNNHLVGLVIEGLVSSGLENHLFVDDILLISDCRNIAQRLKSEKSVSELDSLVAIADEHDFEVVAEHIRSAIEANQPEGALDRLHTFINKFIRVNCASHQIPIIRDTPLHSIFGGYVKALKENGHLESAMTERILKSSISVLESFNDVRNNKSLAHDNPILNYEESLLIFNHVAASIRFIKSLELSIQNMK